MDYARPSRLRDLDRTIGRSIVSDDHFAVQAGGV